MVKDVLTQKKYKNICKKWKTSDNHKDYQSSAFIFGLVDHLGLEPRTVRL